MKEMYEEVDIKEIKKELESEFCYDFEVMIKELLNGIAILDTGVIKNGDFDDYYGNLESIAENICYFVQDNHDVFCEYSILDEGYDIIFNIY